MTTSISDGGSVEEIREFIGADALIYQDVDSMKKVVGALNTRLSGFEASCFDGNYITGDVSPAYLAEIEASRADGESQSRLSSYQLDLGLSTVD